MCRMRAAWAAWWTAVALFAALAAARPWRAWVRLWERGRGCCLRTDTRWAIKSVEQALISYQIDHTDSCATIEELVREKYLSRVPRDAWGQPLYMRCPGVHNPDGADVTSAGRDGMFGTADDFNSWTL
jgi:hypothetical protein